MTTAVSVRTVVDIFLKDVALLSNKERLADALGVPACLTTQWNLHLSTNLFNYETYFTQVINNWAERETVNATIGNLKEILDKNDFIFVSDSLILNKETIIRSNDEDGVTDSPRTTTYPKDVKIGDSVGEGLSSLAGTAPQLPVRFDTITSTGAIQINNVHAGNLTIYHIDHNNQNAPSIWDCISCTRSEIRTFSREEKSLVTSTSNTKLNTNNSNTGQVMSGTGNNKHLTESNCKPAIAFAVLVLYLAFFIFLFSKTYGRKRQLEGTILPTNLHCDAVFSIEKMHVSISPEKSNNNDDKTYYPNWADGIISFCNYSDATLHIDFEEINATNIPVICCPDNVTSIEITGKIVWSFMQKVVALMSQVRMLTFIGETVCQSEIEESPSELRINSIESLHFRNFSRCSELFEDLIEHVHLTSVKEMTFKCVRFESNEMQSLQNFINVSTSLFTIICSNNKHCASFKAKIPKKVKLSSKYYRC